MTDISPHNDVSSQRTSAGIEPLAWRFTVHANKLHMWRLERFFESSWFTAKACIISPIVILVIGLHDIGDSQTKAVPKPTFETPFEVVAYINQNPNADLGKLRQAFEIRPANDSLLARVNECYGRCKAEVLELNSKLKPNELVVKVSYGEENNWYFLFERLSPTNQHRWRFYGTIEWWSYGIAEQEIKEKDGRSWFLIRGLGGKGTGVASYYEAWHNYFDGTSPRVVLWYPFKGHDATGPYTVGYVSRIFNGKVKRFGLNGRRYDVALDFSVTYEAVSDDHLQFSLFTKNQIGYYVWNSSKKAFQLEPRRSTITEPELRNVYNFDTLSDEDFINYNFGELNEMAVRGSIDQTKWLGTFLAKIKDSSKKRALQQALTKPQR